MYAYEGEPRIVVTNRPNGPTLFSTQDYKNWKRLTWICEPVCVWLKNQKTFGSRSLNVLLNKQIPCKSTGLLVQSSSVFSQIFKRLFRFFIRESTTFTCRWCKSRELLVVLNDPTVLVSDAGIGWALTLDFGQVRH